MATTILGKVACTPKGAWSSGASYEVLDIVSNAGSSYIAKQSVPAGTSLSDSDYWLKIASKGDAGYDPTVSVTEITGGHEVSITDAEGTQTFNVMDGEDGDVQSDGVYPQLTAGNAQELDSDLYTTDSVPYLLRASGGGKAVGTRERDTIVGGSVVENQLVNTSDTSITVPSGHKYASYINGTWAVGSSSGSAISVTGGTDMVHDLTQMFGSTVADYLYASGSANAIALLRSCGYIDDTYHAYNAGELKHVSGLTAHVMRGFNQWDEQWEAGSINTNDGTDYPSTSNIRSKNYIPVLSGSTYYIKSPNGVYFFGYDSNKNFVARIPNTSAQLNTTFGVPAGIAYIRFFAHANYGTNYRNDICINISSDKNGTYEPYKAQSYPLDSTLTLRGVPKIVNGELVYDGDTYESDGTVTRRYAVVDLGTLTYAQNGTDSVIVYTPLKSSGSQLVLCDKLTLVASNTEVNNMPEASYKAYSESENIAVKMAGVTYTNASTMLSEIHLVYELATPTTEQADPFATPQIVDPYGTEEYVTTGISVGHYTEYPQSQKAKLDSMPNTLFYTEVAFKATRNYTVNQLIVIGGQLYKVATSIASGATLTVGTNITAVSLGDIITALLNA